MMLAGGARGGQPSKTPSGMVWIPPGEFSTGSTESWRERPIRQETLPGFFIDLHEVTNSEYKKFKRDHFFHPASANKPATSVTYDEAKAYAEWAGKRLPTSLEWEKAARGVDGRLYPWGNDPDSTRLNCVEAGITGTVPVDSYPEGRSPYGLYHVAGNVWEWVEDSCKQKILKINIVEEDQDSGEALIEEDGDAAESGEAEPEVDSEYIEGYLIRGGSWDVTRFLCRTSNSMCMPPDARRPDLGFRCASDAPAR